MSSQPKQWSTPPDLTIDPAKTYTATFKTDKGDIVCQLFAAKVPNTVNNFVFLARKVFMTTYLPSRNSRFYGSRR
jgi:hypothetical protein